ncbi:restriction endonuclease subunit S [Pseudotamlana haliotis]|nr:restriction endonuclease subunit S [Tamlana haliotis]
MNPTPTTNPSKHIPKLRFKEFEGEWESKRFGHLLKSSRLGGNYANNETPNENPLIKMGNLGRGNISLDKIQYVEEGESLNDKDLIQFGDLFFNTRNTLDLVGKVSIWRNELPRAFYNSNLMYIKFENNFFMNYRLNSFQGIKGLRRLATGTTSVAAIYTKDLLKLKLTVPTLPEQQKIATFLSSVDKKIQQLTKKEALLEQYKKGVMQQLFSGKLRFKPDGFTETHSKASLRDGTTKQTDANQTKYPNWEEKRLGEIGFLKNGLNKDKKEFGYGSPFVNLMDVFGKSEIQNKSFDLVNSTDKEKESYSVLKGDVLFIRSSVKRTGVGEAVVVREDLLNTVYSGFLIRYRDQTNNLILEYKKYCFSSQSFRKELLSYATSSANTNINQESLNKLKVNIPCLEEQQKIASFLSSIDTKIEAVNTQISQTQSFKKGLLQQMFV